MKWLFKLFKLLLVCCLLFLVFAVWMEWKIRTVDTLQKRVYAGDVQAWQELAQRAAQGDGFVTYRMLSMKIPNHPDVQQALAQYAAQGEVWAQYNLGLLYAKGQGVRQDYAQARHWWEKAAAQGLPDAMISLGMMYEKGRGVWPDKQAAQEWYDKACCKDGARICIPVDKYRPHPCEYMH